jgi:hypothetical protein
MRLPLDKAYTFASNNGLADEATKIREMNVNLDNGRQPTIRRSYIIRLFQKNNLLPEFIKLHWKDGENQLERCLRIGKEYDQSPEGKLSDEEDDDVEIKSSTSFEFALEAHLRDFLARNLGEIEPGLKLYQPDGLSGVEFVIESGRIDILAVDAAGNFVVIELKLSQGRTKALGQLLYYMGWIEANLAKAPCRGIIIASDISQELAVAVSRVAGITLFRYKMSFSVEPAKCQTKALLNVH